MLITFQDLAEELEGGFSGYECLLWSQDDEFMAQYLYNQLDIP